MIRQVCSYIDGISIHMVFGDAIEQEDKVLLFGKLDGLKVGPFVIAKCNVKDSGIEMLVYDLTGEYNMERLNNFLIERKEDIFDILNK